MDWKWPCALFYVKKKLVSSYNIPGKSSVCCCVMFESQVNPLTACLIKLTVSLAKNPFDNYEALFSEAALASGRARSSTMIPLSGEEKLESGDVVGIDAEFVSLNQVRLTVLLHIPSPSLLPTFPQNGRTK